MGATITLGGYSMGQVNRIAQTLRSSLMEMGTAGLDHTYTMVMDDEGAVLKITIEGTRVSAVGDTNATWISAMRGLINGFQVGKAGGGGSALVITTTDTGQIVQDSFSHVYVSSFDWEWADQYQDTINYSVELTVGMGY